MFSEKAGADGLGGVRRDTNKVCQGRIGHDNDRTHVPKADGIDSEVGEKVSK